MLSVSKRGKLWQYRFDIGKINGKRKQISKSGFKTKKECVEAGTAAYNQYNQSGMVIKDSEITVNDFADTWYEEYVKINLKPNSQKTYKNLIDKFVKKSIGHYKMKAITPMVLQSWFNDLKKSDIKRNTAYGIKNVIKSIFQYGVEMQIISQNPIQNVRMPRFTDKTVKNIVDVKTFNKIMTLFPVTDIYHIILLLAFHTGMRKGEIYALTWNDIDFTNRCITINKQMSYINGTGILVGTPKTKSSIRKVYFGDTLYHSLKTVLKMQKENRLREGKYYIENYPEYYDDGIQKIISAPICDDVQTKPVQFVCRYPHGELMSPLYSRVPFERIKKKLDINISLHCLRHSHGTLLIENGANMKDVMDRLGHSDIKTTMNIYVHDTDQMKKQTVDIFEKAIK